MHLAGSVTRQRVKKKRWCLFNMKKDIWLFFLPALGEYLMRKKILPDSRREDKTERVGIRGMMVLGFCLQEWI